MLDHCQNLNRAYYPRHKKPKLRHDALTPVYGKRDFVNKGLENKRQLRHRPPTAQQRFLLQKYQNYMYCFPL